MKKTFFTGVAIICTINLSACGKTDEILHIQVEPMSEEEYQEIIGQYATEPVELEWTSLVISAE